MRSALSALSAGLIARRWRIAVATGVIFVLYQAMIAVSLSLGLGGAPNYLKLYPAWTNARRIVALTPSWIDIAALLWREPIAEYGRRHPSFGIAVWSYELTWSSVIFFLSFSLLVGVYVALAAMPRGWGALGSLGSAGVVGMLGASVSSLTHCGFGSFGVLLALAGISTGTIAWFGWLEPVLIPAGYVLMLSAVIGRAAQLATA